MGYETYTVDQLVDATAALNDQADGLFDTLGRITATAAGSGVGVRVNLEGRLLSLDLSPEAMALEPDELAAEIFRLTQEASAAALSDGLAALEPVAGEELTAELSEIIAARPSAPVPAPAPTERAPAPVRTLDHADDFSAVESWALPR
ncbi:hypothetical protein [Actinophytocola sp.]|uniref:hypothetical protein n=1 Tax=Actinophytocola sp. TaxID=1872138 RepID=UPI002ED90DC6